MIYLDHAATTPCAEEVLDAMLPYFRDQFGNASSIDHVLGANAKNAVEQAREAIGELVGAQPEDVVFTSGSTEANNLALSVALPVSTTPIEHPSILDVVKHRSRDVDTFLEIGEDGLVVGDALSATMKQRRCLVSVIATNNETGVEQNIDEIAARVVDAGCFLHLDATQAVGTRAIDMKTVSISACSISAHKIYGPKGIGALVVSGQMRREIHPLQYGGGHERGLRSGTLNVPGIVGFGVAASLARRWRRERREKLDALQRHFLEALGEVVGDNVVRTVRSAPTSSHILSLRLKGTNARALIRGVRDTVAFSLGSACATNKAEPSHVLLALGLDKKTIAETIRCSFSSEQTVEEVETAAKAIGEAAKALAGYSLTA